MRKSFEGKLGASQKRKVAIQLREDWQERSGLDRLAIRGVGMRPLLIEGDQILMRKIEPRRLKIGDIVVFSKEGTGRLAVHRFLWRVSHRENQPLICKSDNWLTIDKPVDPELLLGKVVHIEGANKRIDLENLSWRIIFRVLGIMSVAEVSIWQLFGGLKKIFLRQVVGTPYLKKAFWNMVCLGKRILCNLALGIAKIC